MRRSSLAIFSTVVVVIVVVVVVVYVVVWGSLAGHKRLLCFLFYKRKKNNRVRIVPTTRRLLNVKSVFCMDAEKIKRKTEKIIFRINKGIPTRPRKIILDQMYEL